jgi:hypothetical protein
MSAGLFLMNPNTATARNRIFAAYERPGEFVSSHISKVVTQKHSQVVADIGLPDVMRLFAGKKALPAFLAFCQTCTARVGSLGPIPMSVNMLYVGEFGGVHARQRVFDKINSALHDCLQ